MVPDTFLPRETAAMTRRYLAFDIETAKDVPGVEFNWRAHRPLGISCAPLCDAMLSRSFGTGNTTMEPRRSECRGPRREILSAN